MLQSSGNTRSALNRTQQQLIARAFDNAICDAVFEQEKAEKKIDSQKFLNALEVFRDKPLSCGAPRRFERAGALHALSANAP